MTTRCWWSRAALVEPTGRGGVNTGDANTGDANTGDANTGDANGGSRLDVCVAPLTTPPGIITNCP
ncbi:pentapeptide repeat-containing protein [Streptomyces sp. H27-D2]|uniref:pentapeptide repeat-containing protein n=1 Tax=Streptomyces sp. H27-D2 TaxID=3046304 RepID=UPI002DB579DA|nr:pentapeptide repeat-containing protein [Streptomyces sp. H27-D2]MEC4020063.1 pentapeptide repeat-containing protein [Streptomyces sp. H27-D2]